MLEFLENPISRVAVHGTTANFSCTAENVSEILYFVNGSNVSTVSDENFLQLQPEILSESLQRRNLTVIVSLLFNNTEIFCRAIGGGNTEDSDVAYLTVQGTCNIMHCTICTNNLKIF